jgi:hypothetical protein
MAKTVNVSVIVTRDGKTTAQNFDKIGYATFVALQSALSGVLSVLQSMGATRVASQVDGIKSPASPGGDCDLRAELRADHGQGTSEVVIGYTGISKETADEIQGALLGAVASVVKP